MIINEIMQAEPLEDILYNLNENQKINILAFFDNMSVHDIKILLEALRLLSYKKSDLWTLQIAVSDQETKEYLEMLIYAYNYERQVVIRNEENSSEILSCFLACDILMLFDEQSEYIDLANQMQLPIVGFDDNISIKEKRRIAIPKTPEHIGALLWCLTGRDAYEVLLDRKVDDGLQGEKVL